MIGETIGMPDSLPDCSAATARGLRLLALLGMLATTVGNGPAALNAVVKLRWLVVDVSSEHGAFRQRFDIGLQEVERLARASDFAAATTTLEFLRRLVLDLENSLEARHGQPLN